MKDENTKVTSFYYQYSELNLLEEYLTEQAAQGWLLQTIKGQHLTFARIEPQTLRFCVLVYDFLVLADWVPKQQIEEFIETCEQACWHLTATSKGGILQIFHSSDPMAPAILVDPKVKLKTIYKLMYNGWLAIMFSVYLFFNIGFPLIIGGMTDKMIYNISLTLMIIALELSIWFIAIYIMQLSWYIKAKKALDQGMEIQPYKHHVTNVPVTMMMLINIGFSLYCMALYDFRCPDWAFWTFVSFMVLLACSASVQVMLLAAKKISRSVQVGGVILAIIYAAFYITSFMFFGSIETKQPLPLSLNTLGISDAIDDERYFESNAPGLIYKTEFRDDSKTASLACEMYETKFSFLIPTILAEEFFCYRYEASERDELLTEAFSANDVYHDNYDDSNSYLVVYDDTVIEIKTDWELTAEQMQAVGGEARVNEMIFKEIDKYPRATSVVFSQKYIATATVPRAYVFDRDTKKQLASFGYMSNVFTVYITPDEKMLIVRGTTHFIWFYSLEKMKLLKKYTIRESTYTQDQGSAVSQDSKYFYYIVMKNDLLTMMIKIDLMTLEIVDRFFTDERYVMKTIQYIPERQQFFIFGYKRPDQDYSHGGINKDFYMWFDGEKTTELLWPETEPCHDVYYSADEDRYFALKSGKIYCAEVFDSKGKSLKKIDLEMKYKIGYCEYPNNIAYDDQEKILYVISTQALYAIEPETGEILTATAQLHGFQNIRLLEQAIIASSLSGGTLIYQLIKSNISMDFEADRQALIERLEKEIFDEEQKIETFKQLKRGELKELENRDLMGAIMYWLWNKIQVADAREFSVIQSLPQPCQYVYACYSVVRDVNSGGFSKMFFQYTRHFAFMAYEGFAIIGLADMSKVMAAALEIFTTNRELLKSYDDGTVEGFNKSRQLMLFDKLDEAFSENECLFGEHLLAYIRAHENEFGD